MEWLIVFDNADDIGILPPYWPSSSHGSVLITSRNPLAHGEGLASSAISLQPFDIEDGGKFLRSYLDPGFVPSPEDLEAIQHLSSLFGGMPIGLRQAAAFMTTKRCNPTKFVRIYKERKEEVEQLQLPAYSKTLANVWEMSLSTLTPDALDFLDILSLCDPDSIPTEMFQKGLPETVFGSFLGDTVRQLNATEGLSNQSLINVTPRNDILSLHRIFHNATFSKLEKRNERYQKAFESLVESLLLAIPHDYLVGRSPDQWNVAEIYSRHVNMLCSRSLHNVPPASIIPFLNLLNKLVG